MHIQNKKLWLLRLFVAATASLPVCSGATAGALQTDDKCRIYSSDEADIPPQLERKMNERGDKMAQACISGAENITFYASVQLPKKQPLGVCAFQIEPPTIPGVAERPELGAEVFMFYGAGICPSPGDPQYIPANGVSEGVFLRITELMRRIVSSSSQLEAATSPSLRHTRSYNGLMREISRSHGKLRLEVRGVALADQRKGQGYEVLLDSATSQTGWLINIDLTRNGFIVMGLRRIPGSGG